MHRQSVAKELIPYCSAFEPIEVKASEGSILSTLACTA